MRYCEFAEEVAAKTGVDASKCSKIWVETLRAVKYDFAALDPPFTLSLVSLNPPKRMNPKLLYEYFKDKRTGIRVGPFKICINIYQLFRRMKEFNYKNYYVKH